MFRKAQSTVEYVILVSAVILAILWVAVAKIFPDMTSSLSHVSDEMNSSIQKIDFDGTP